LGVPVRERNSLGKLRRWCPGPESNRHALRRGILSPIVKWLNHAVFQAFVGAKNVRILIDCLD
jgi:hypothetical protein